MGSLFMAALRMALQACDAVILIARYLSQMFIVHSCTVVFMAVDAGKDSIAGRVGMAIRTIVPLTLVFP